MLSTISKRIIAILKNLPSEPGVYQFYDIKGKIIYVGKAKSLKNRVRSYFHNNQIGKTKVLVKKIFNIKFIIVETEHDALLLENNLIKKYKPPYNILLKDDKTYPWICIKKERFPRVVVTRNIINDGSEYFGPYTSRKMVNTLIELINKIFNLRNCIYDLSVTNVFKKKYTTCLEYHINNCEGPCEGKESEEDYNLKIKQIKKILNGNISAVINYLNNLMINYSNNLDFENADFIKKKIFDLNFYQSKSTVVNPKISNLDVFSLYSTKTSYFVNYFNVSNGSIIQGYTVEAHSKLEESEEDVLKHIITELKIRFNSNNKNIICTHNINLPGLIINNPIRGDKKKLLDLSFRNAKYFALEKNNFKISTKENSSLRILEDLKTKFNLKDLPIHIECFDNSNIQGYNPVSSCVVFKNGKPCKQEYRHFNIKSVKGPDDYASMKEVLNRRYTKLLKEKKPLPQLIIIDGGKGQLSSSVEVLKNLGLFGKVAIVGIAKRLEEIFFPGDSNPMYIDKRSECLKLIQFLRNEAHRYAINHHRNKRSLSMLGSDLDNIKGIGAVSKKRLLIKFKSVKGIMNASIKEIENCIGVSKGKVVYEYYKKNKS